MTVLHLRRRPQLHDPDKVMDLYPPEGEEKDWDAVLDYTQLQPEYVEMLWALEHAESAGPVLLVREDGVLVVADESRVLLAAALLQQVDVTLEVLE